MVKRENERVAERNTKHQIPSAKEVPNLNHQTQKQIRGKPRAGRFLSLEFGASFELGVWNLELLAWARIAAQRARCSETLISLWLRGRRHFVPQPNVLPNG